MVAEVIVLLLIEFVTGTETEQAQSFQWAQREVYWCFPA